MSCINTTDLKCFVNNDTYKAKLITLPFDVTDHSFLVQFRKQTIGENNNPVAFEWSTADNTIEFVDAENGEIKLLKKEALSVEIGTYIGDFQMTKPNGDIETLFRLRQEVIQDISRS